MAYVDPIAGFIYGRNQVDGGYAPGAEPGPRRTSKKDFPVVAGVWYYDQWDTPWNQDSYQFAEGNTAAGIRITPAYNAFRDNNLPDKYRAEPRTTHGVPTDNNFAPHKGPRNGRFGNGHGDVYPAGSYAVEYPEGGGTPTQKPPFDVNKIIAFVGKHRHDASLTVKPDLKAIPDKHGFGKPTAIAVIEYILDASGLPYTVRRHYNQLVAKDEHPLVGAFDFEDWLGNDHGNIGRGIIGDNRFRVPSKDDGHNLNNTSSNAYLAFDGHDIFQDGHTRYDAIDIETPNGTRAEIVAILNYLRAFATFFSKVNIGPLYRSRLDGSQFYLGALQSPMPWHYSTGHISRNDLIIFQGERYEKSQAFSYFPPNYYSQRYDTIAPTGAPFDGAVFTDYYVPPRTTAEGFTPALYQAGPPVPSGFRAYEYYRPTFGWGYVTCSESGVIHIQTEMQRVFDAASLLSLDSALAPTAAPAVKSLKKPGNSPAQPNPGMAYPPILTTDMPAGIPGSGSTIFGEIGTSFTLGVCRIPNGFKEPEYANGLALFTRRKSAAGAQDTRDSYELGFHKPSSSLKGYSAGWTVLDAPDGSPTDNGVMGAQRRGEWVYTIAGKSYSSGQHRIQTVERSNSIYLRERRESNESTYYEGLGSAASGAPANNYEYADNQDLWVSDHLEPHLYHLSGFTGGKAVDRNGLPMAWHWIKEDQRGFGSGDDSSPFYPTHRFKYEFWHTYQDLEGTGPANTQWPCFVHPWGAGDYDPPEMWFFVPEIDKSSNNTHRLRIYRSTYQPGNWSMSRGYQTLAPRWVDYFTGSKTVPRATPAGFVGRLRTELVSVFDQHNSPTNNPKNEAFNGAWYQEQNYVGTVGPFRGAIFGSTRNVPNGGNRVFRVLRDPRKKDRLHLVMQQKASVFAEDTGAWDGAWFTTSNNNGLTWGRTHQINPFVEPRTGWEAGPYRGAAAVAITQAGDLLGTAHATWKMEEVQSLVNINYSGGGYVNGINQRPTIFRTGSGGL